MKADYSESNSHFYTMQQIPQLQALCDNYRLFRFKTT